MSTKIPELITILIESNKTFMDFVPTTWPRRRAKFIFRERKDVSKDGSEDLLSASHITGITKRSDKDVNMFLAETNEGYKIVKAGDAVINTMWAWMGAMGVSSIDGIISPSYGVYYPLDKIETRYFDYLFRSVPFVTDVNRKSKGVWSSRLRLYPDMFLDMMLPFPALDIQKQIADFLDQEIGRIDELIGKKERLIKMLEVRFDSYLNEVMSEYARRKLKTLAVAQLSGVDKHIYEDEIQVRVVHYTDAYYNDSITHATNLSIGSVSALERQKFRLKGNEVVITKDSETPEDIAIPAYIENVEENTVCGYHLAIIRPNATLLDGKFLFWSLKTKAVRDYFCLSAQGVTRFGIPIGKISDCPLLYTPNIEDQKKLGIDLFSKNSSKSELIKKILLSIDYLKQFRVSLITEAVTGQLDINQWKNRSNTDRQLDKIEVSSC